MRVRLQSFVPDVRWSFIEFTKAKFVRDLMALEIIKLSEKMPPIELPIKEAILIGAPESVENVRFETSKTPSFLTVRKVVPATEWRAKPTDIQFHFTSDGFFLFGRLT
jgi:hypothetical protein